MLCLWEKNPSTIIDIVIDHNNQFKYIFYSSYYIFFRFHTSIRLVIIIDGTFLKAKYLRTLFVVTYKHDNNQIYPLRFKIGDFKNNASWNGFSGNGIEWLDVDDLVVVLDCHISIEKVVWLMFPHASHGVCTYHMRQPQNKVEECYSLWVVSWCCLYMPFVGV